MTSIYLAAPWVRREEARLVRDRLVAAGYEVTSRWLDIDETKTTETIEAENDVYDILTAELMVVLNLEKSEGKAVEQGIAIAINTPLYLVGEKSNVFHHLPNYTIVPDVDALLLALPDPGLI